MCNSGHWGSSRRVFASKNMAVWPAIYIARYIDDIVYIIQIVQKRKKRRRKKSAFAAGNLSFLLSAGCILRTS